MPVTQLSDLDQENSSTLRAQGPHFGDRTQVPQIPERGLAYREGGNAETWFEEAHRAVIPRSSIADTFQDDPPFYLNEITPEVTASYFSPVPEDPILSYMRANDSERENEELRGIIDDLTLDIRRLKRKLKKYKEFNPRHLQKDKLFEVRIHGLPAQRKRQLEDLLKRFATDVALSSIIPNLRPGKEICSENLSSESHLEPSEEDRMALLVNILEHFIMRDVYRKKTTFDPPTTSSHMKLPSEDEWMSLDDLLKIASREIFNVTRDFGQESVRRFSTRLQLSPDGQNIRWRTRHDNSERDHSDNGSATFTVCDTKGRTSSLSSNDSERLLPLGIGNTGRLYSQKFDPAIHAKYDPSYKSSTMMIRATKGDDVMISSSSDRFEVPGDASATSTTNPRAISKKKQQNALHGAVSFYKDATFCVDLSCDALDKVDPGAGMTSQITDQVRPKVAANRFPSYPNDQDEAMEVNAEPISSPTISLDAKPLSPASDEGNRHPIQLQASGVGEVLPEDNFAIHVRVKRFPTDSGSNRPLSQQYTNSSLSRIATSQINTSHVYQAHIVSTRHESLPPSELPPPMCGIFSSSSSIYDEESSNSHEARSQIGYGKELRSHETSIERWNEEVVTSLAEGSDSNSDSDGNSDSDVDMSDDDEESQ